MKRDDSEFFLQQFKLLIILVKLFAIFFYNFQLRTRILPEIFPLNDVYGRKLLRNGRVIVDRNNRPKIYKKKIFILRALFGLLKVSLIFFFLTESVFVYFGGQMSHVPKTANNRKWLGNYAHASFLKAQRQRLQVTRSSSRLCSKSSGFRAFRIR